MPGNFKKEDLRNHRTRKALLDAMAQLLEVRNYNQITINDLCEEALIGRSTFYSHFNNKYDLLKCWLANGKQNVALDDFSYEAIEKSVNGFANTYKNVIKNLLEDITSETSELLRDLFLSVLNLPKKKPGKEPVSPNDVILAAICYGGIQEYLLWQVENKFPPGVPVMNRNVYDLFLSVYQWNERQRTN